MLDWSKVRFATCRLCGAVADQPPSAHGLCCACRARCLAWFHRRADIVISDATDCDKSWTADRTLAKTDGEDEYWVKWPEHYRTNEASLTAADVVEWTLMVIRNRPRWFTHEQDRRRKEA